MLPHPEAAPAGAEFIAPPGVSLCDALLNNRIDIEHACGKVGARTTCHVIVAEGFTTLEEATDAEEDMLDRAWGVEQCSRLSCQALVNDADLTLQIPRYTLNHAKENE